MWDCGTKSGPSITLNKYWKLAFCPMYLFITRCFQFLKNIVVILNVGWNRNKRLLKWNQCTLDELTRHEQTSDKQVTSLASDSQISRHYMSVSPSVCMPVCLSVCLSIYNFVISFSLSHTHKHTLSLPLPFSLSSSFSLSLSLNLSLSLSHTHTHTQTHSLFLYRPLSFSLSLSHTHF